jgi:hypothetical protein
MKSDRTSISVATISVIAALALQGCANPPIAGGSNLTTAEKMMWSTYAIATPKGLATCMIVNRRDPVAPHHTVPVLITAAHVLASAPRGPFYVVVRTPNGSEAPSLEILEFAPSAGIAHPFFQHPSHDVAMLELNIPPDLAGEATLPSFLNESDIGRTADVPHAGDDVSVLGFPHVLPGTLGAFPVLRAGRVASRVQGPGADNERLLINTSAFAGDSGAGFCRHPVRPTKVDRNLIAAHRQTGRYCPASDCPQRIGCSRDVTVAEGAGTLRSAGRHTGKYFASDTGKRRRAVAWATATAQQERDQKTLEPVSLALN